MISLDYFVLARWHNVLKAFKEDAPILQIAIFVALVMCSVGFVFWIQERFFKNDGSVHAEGSEIFILSNLWKGLKEGFSSITR